MGFNWAGAAQGALSGAGQGLQIGQAIDQQRSAGQKEQMQQIAAGAQEAAMIVADPGTPPEVKERVFRQRLMPLGNAWRKLTKQPIIEPEIENQLWQYYASANNMQGPPAPTQGGGLQPMPSNMTSLASTMQGSLPPGTFTSLLQGEQQRGQKLQDYEQQKMIDQRYATPKEGAGDREFAKINAQLSPEGQKLLELKAQIESKYGNNKAIDEALKLLNIQLASLSLGEKQDPAGAQAKKPLTPEDATKFQVPMGATYGDVAGKVPPKEPTQTQGLVNTYLMRMEDAEDVFNELAPAINTAGTLEHMYQRNVPNPAKSETWQKQEQAERDFMGAVLRRESGATITKEEMSDGIQKYFPRPGDKPGTLAQKKRNRETQMRGFKQEAGPAYKARSRGGKNKQYSITGTDKRTGRKIGSNDGKKYFDLETGEEVK